MEFDVELTLNLLGMAACTAAASYMFVVGHKKAAALLVAGFTLHLQSAVYITFAENPVGEGSCWLANSFYQCLPLWHKVSIHAAQLGHYLIAIGVLMIATSAQRNRASVS